MANGPGGALAHVLRRLALWSASRPRLAWALLLLPTLLLALAAARTPVDLSFAGLMDREHPEVRRYFEASAAWGLGGRLPLMLEGDEAQLDAASEVLVTQLGAREDVRSVRAGAPTAWLDTHKVWLVSSQSFAAWKTAVDEPGNADARARLKALVEAQRDEPFAAPGKRLVLVTLRDDSLAQGLDAQAFPEVAAATESLLKPFGVSGRYAGMPAIVEQDQATTLGRIAWLTPLSLVLALAFLFGVERRARGLLAIGAPMVLAGTATVCAMGLAFGRITLMEALFGVMVFGLGVDFAIHLGLRARDEQGAHGDFAAAVATSFAATGPGVVAGALTTAGAFALAALAPEPTFVHLGLTGALGIMLCLGAMLVGLPAAWAMLGARAPGLTNSGPGAEGAVPVPRGGSFGLGGKMVLALSGSAARRPWVHLGAAALAVALGVVGLGKLSYESDLRRIVNRDLDAVPAAEAMARTFGVDPMPWVFAVDTLPQARELESQLLADPNFARVESATRLFLSDTQERRAWIAEARPRLEALRAASQEAAELVDPLLEADLAGPPTAAGLPAGLRDQLVAPDGRWLVYAFSAQPHMDAARAKVERQAARVLDPSATSMAVLFEVLIGTERPWVPRVLGAVLAFVMLLLWFDLRQLRWVLLALVPVSVGAVLAFGALGWAGVSMNTVTVLAAPLVLGLGVDDGIHVVHRLREAGGQAGPAAVADAVARVGRAIALTTATTCASFGTLVFSGHPGMSSMAWVMLTALPLCLLASVSTLTALATLINKRTASLVDTQVR